MELFIVISVTVALLYLAFELLSKKTNPKAPPSVPSLSILGSIPFLSGSNGLHIFFMEQVKRSGNVYGIYFGSKYTVVVNGYEAIYEALVKRTRDFAGRENFYIEKYYVNLERRGIISKQFGKEFKKNRLHSLNVMKQLGYGNKGVMEARMHAVVQDLIAYAQDKKGTAFDPRGILEMSSLNVIYNLLFNYKLALESSTSIILRSWVSDVLQGLDPIYEVFPLIAQLPPYRHRIKELIPKILKFTQFCRDKVNECALQENGDNFVKKYIEKAGSSNDQEELAFILRDFIGAAIDAIASQISWALIFVGNNPDIQDRLHKEIDDVVPREYLPSFNYKAKLPYLEAVILETLRIRTGAPLGVPHTTLCDTELCGYDIPAGTPVVFNLYSSNMDNSIWKDPDVFKPERFLDENNKLVNQEKVISFSLGRRACPGEELARQQLFQFLSGLLQQFNILPPEGETSIVNKVEIGLGILPAPYKLRLVPRVL